MPPWGIRTRKLSEIICLLSEASLRYKYHLPFGQIIFRKLFPAEIIEKYLFREIFATQIFSHKYLSLCPLGA